MSDSKTPSNRRPDPPINDSVMAMFSMKGKVALITGAGGGIGLEVAKAFAEAGADVAITFNSNKSAHDRANEIAEKYGVTAKAYKMQANDKDSVAECVKQVHADFGRLDNVVVNHGIPSQTSVLEGGVKEWEKVVNIDFNGAFYVALAAGEIFKQQKSGNLIFTASMSGHIVNWPQLQGCYNACKAALIHLGRSLAVEWAEFNARVNTVSPGYIHTEISDFVPKEIQSQWYDLTPMKRDGDPRELKAAYLYLASDASSYATGTDIIVDGGYCCR